MTPDDLVERVARAMWMADVEPYDPENRIPFEQAPETSRAYCLAEARAAIAVALEEAAKVADAMFWEHTNGKFDSFNNDPSWNAGDHGAYIASTISAGIRALKEASDE